MEKTGRGGGTPYKKGKLHKMGVMIHSMREGRITPCKKGKINRMGVMIHTLGVGGGNSI